ncbi:MAG: extracellular solute-binding protein [Anaerolineae bacterium]|nr:extracellular solute-binding protein [Anaerolineae bacterium]
MKLFQFGLGLCLLVGLAGCMWIAPEPPVSPLPTSTATPELLITPTETVKPPVGLITLSLWVPDFLSPYQEEDEAAALLVERLNDFATIYPDIQVEVSVKASSGEGGVYNLLSTAALAAPDVVPDVVILGEADLQTGAKSELLQPIENTVLKGSDYFPFAKEGVMVDAVIFGVPFVSQAEQTVYRSRVSASAPLSWTAVLSGGYSMLWPAAPSNGLASDALLAAYLGSSDIVLSEDNILTLDRVQLENLYRFVSRSVELGLLTPESALKTTDARSCWDVYLEGGVDLSLVPMGLYWTGDIPYNSNPGWIPTQDGSPVILGNLWSLALTTEVPARQEAAIHLIQWLTDPQFNARFTYAAELMPPRYRALGLWALSEEDLAFVTAMMESVRIALPATIDIPVRQALQVGVEALLLGDVDTPEGAATRALTVLR